MSAENRDEANGRTTEHERPSPEEISHALELLGACEMVGRPLHVDEARHCGSVMKRLEREVKGWELTETLRNHADAQRQMEKFAVLMRSTPCAVCGSYEHAAQGSHDAI